VSGKVFVFVLAAYLLQRVNLRQEHSRKSAHLRREIELLYDRDGFVQLLAIEVDAELVLERGFCRSGSFLPGRRVLSVLLQPGSRRRQHGYRWRNQHAGKIASADTLRASSAPNSWRDNRTLKPGQSGITPPSESGRPNQDR